MFTDLYPTYSKIDSYNTDTKTILQQKNWVQFIRILLVFLFSLFFLSASVLRSSQQCQFWRNWKTCKQLLTLFFFMRNISDFLKHKRDKSLLFTSVTQEFSSRSCEGVVLIFAKRMRWTAELCNKVIPVPWLGDSSGPCSVGGQQ